MPAQKIPANELKLADVVELEGIDGFNTAIVKKVEDDSVILFRPYGASEDFSYTGGVICLVGIEEFRILRNKILFNVLRRKDLK